jgi:hypothetical protein
MCSAFCVDLGDGSIWGTPAFVSQTPSSSTLDVDVSSSIQVPIHNCAQLTSTPDLVRLSPPSLSGLSGDSVIHTPLESVANDIGTATTNGNINQMPDTWSDAYMDGWIFAQSPEMMIRPECAALIPACDVAAFPTANNPPCDLDPHGGKLPRSPYPAPIFISTTAFESSDAPPLAAPCADPTGVSLVPTAAFIPELRCPEAVEAHLATDARPASTPRSARGECARARARIGRSCRWGSATRPPPQRSSASVTRRAPQQRA